MIGEYVFCNKKSGFRTASIVVPGGIEPPQPEPKSGALPLCKGTIISH